MSESDITSLDLEGAQDAVDYSTKVKDGLSNQADELIKILQENFGCWGDDETGHAFDEGYVPLYNDFRTQLQGLVKYVADLNESLARVPNEFRNQDEANAQQLK